jgi:hypothetical protein
MTATINQTTIAGNTLEELAHEWAEQFDSNVYDSLTEKVNDDADYADTLETGDVDADILNTAEQDAWNTLRDNYSAFGFDQDAEDEVSATVDMFREDGKLSEMIAATVQKVLLHANV